MRFKNEPEIIAKLNPRDFNKIKSVISADRQSGDPANISVLLYDSAPVWCAQIRAMRNLWPETFCQTQVSRISELILSDVSESECSVTRQRGPAAPSLSPPPPLLRIRSFTNCVIVVF